MKQCNPDSKHTIEENELSITSTNYIIILPSGTEFKFFPAYMGKNILIKRKLLSSSSKK